MNFIKDTILTFFTQIAYVILGMGASVLVATALGPEGKGAYALIILVPTLLAAVGNLGIGIANVYFGRSRKHAWGELVSNSLAASFALGLTLAIAFAVFFLVFQPSFLLGIDARAIFLSAAVLPFSLLSMYFTFVLIGQNRIKEYNWVHLVQGGMGPVLLVLLLFVWKGGVFGATMAWACAMMAGAVLSMLLVGKATRIKWAFHLQLFKKSVKFGFQGQLGNIIQLVNHRLDMFLIAYLMGTTDVGYYSISVALAETLWYLPASAGAIIFAKTPGTSTEEANRSTPVICRNIFFLTLIAALALFLLGKSIITLLFGAAFLPAVRPLNILLPGIVASSICKVLSNELTGRGKPMINTVAAGISLAVNIPLNIIFIPRMGIAGSALASSISYSLTALAVLVAFMKISGNGLFETLVLRPKDLKAYARTIAEIRAVVFGEGKRHIGGTEPGSGIGLQGGESSSQSIASVNRQDRTPDR